MKTRLAETRLTPGLILMLCLAVAPAWPADADSAAAGSQDYDLDSLLGPAEDTSPSAPESEPRSGPSAVKADADAGAESGEAAVTPAKAAPTRKTLENIVVVAQKKEESIQDVPISISVVDEEFIEEWSITDLNTAVQYTPNVKIADAGYFIMPRVRGFGVDQNNKAFEPPAGVAIDGIPYTRLEYFTSALFDLQRLEVYRGPQGTAFGKNTTAGLIHLITKSPTPEFEGSFDYQYGDFDRRRLEFGVGGPLVENFLNFRVAGLSDSRTGFVRNSAIGTATGAPEFGRGTEREGFRVKLDFVDLFGSSLKISAEKVDTEAIGAGVELFGVTDAMKAAIRRYDPNSDFERSNYINSINDPDYRRVGLETYNLEWSYDIGDWGLVALGGYSVLEGEAALDVDITPAPAIFGADKDRSPTTTGELRLESPQLDGLLGLDSLLGFDLGSSNVLTGVYYQKRDIQGEGIDYQFGLSYVDLLLASTASSQDGVLGEALDSLVTALFPIIPPLFGNSNTAYTERVTQDFDQQAEAEAVFAQTQWQFLPTWGVEYGIRFNSEKKSAQWDQRYTSAGPSLLLPLLSVEEYQKQKSRDESNIAQRASLNFEPNDDIGIFLHWARGFRGGGYNAFSFRGNDEDLEYKSESAEDWGLDFKTTLLDGRMRLNLSLFRLDVDDFQVLVGEANERGVGLGSNRVENAASARSQGVEADLTWLVFDWFTLFSTLGVNDTEYLEFTNNGCFADNRNSDGDDDPRCDVSGKAFPLTPKYTATMLGMATIPLSRSGLVMQVGGGFDYQTEQYTNFSLDDRFIQGDVTRWRASVGIGNVFQGWSFRLQGENLTNEIVVVRQGQILRGSYLEGIEAPRTIYGSFHYNF